MAKLHLMPINRPDSRAFVARHHRHSNPPAPASSIFQVAVANEEEEVVGVAIAGPPSARKLWDGYTIEVLRVATTGDHNAPSMLYGACCRAARALGYRRAITYTLWEESGASLRAAGWTRDGEAGGGSWRRDESRPRASHLQPQLFDGLQHPPNTGRKVRWSRQL